MQFKWKGGFIQGNLTLRKPPTFRHDYLLLTHGIMVNNTDESDHYTGLPLNLKHSVGTLEQIAQPVQLLI